MGGTGLVGLVLCWCMTEGVCIEGGGLCLAMAWLNW